MNLLGGQARQLRLALLQAPDHAVGRVVAMLDGMADRSTIDQVLDSVRPRLRRLQPPRPLRLPRLLFLPLDAALVAPSAWRVGTLLIPRNAIAPVAALVSEALPELSREVEALACAHTMNDHAVVAGLGARLWPAASLVTTRQIPPGWGAAGLPDAAAAPILALCAALWRNAVPLWQARMAAASGTEDALPLAQAALAPLVAEGAGPLSAGLALLLRSSVMPGQIASLATRLSGQIHPAAERELTRLLVDDAAAVAAASSTREMAEVAGLLARRLSDLEQTASALVRDERRRHAATLRRDTGQACHAHFAEAMVALLLAPAARAATGPRAEDVVVAALEAAARDLRRLEAAGRRLGQETAFDHTLRDAVTQIAALAAIPSRGLNRIELARLVEILAGPEAALVLAEALQGNA